MSDPRWYRFTLTVGPIGFYGPGNKLHSAQRFARQLRWHVAPMISNGRESKYVRCDFERVEPPR